MQFLGENTPEEFVESAVLAVANAVIFAAVVAVKTLPTNEDLDCVNNYAFLKYHQLNR